MLAVVYADPARKGPCPMLTREDDIEAHALRKKGWSITAIARHLGRDRKTVRAYLNGDRVPGVRAKPVGRQLDLSLIHI